MRKWLGGVVALIVLVVPASCTKSSRTSPGNVTQPGPQSGMTSFLANQALPMAAWLSGIFPKAAEPSLASGVPATRAPAPGTAEHSATAPGASGPKQTIALAREQPAPATTVAPRQNTDVTSLLTLGRDSRILPEDFKIGAFGDARAGDPDDQQAMAVAGSFLGRLVSGKVEAALLDPSSESRVSDMLDFGIQRGDVPLSYRLGAPKKHEGGEITASIRLFGTAGTSEGEISLARVGGHWLVTDLQISMDDLQAKQEKPTERFFPSSYRWMLEE